MGTMRTTELATDHREIYYPESDGKPMAETDLHRDEMFELIAMLQARYEDAPDVYVSGNLLLYHVEGDPTQSVAPDTFVVFGVAKGQRRTYKLWEEGVAPAVAFEVTSRKTRREDRRTKKALYARLGVTEYFLYDPEADYLRPPLQGFRLTDDDYVALTPDATGALQSERLGLDLRLEGGRLQLYDVATGARLPRLAEQAKALRRAEERARWANARAEQADARAEQAAAQAKQANVRAEQANARAAQADARAEDAEAEVARLRDELAWSRRGEV